MSLEVPDAIIMQWVGQYFWPFCRIGAFMLVVPLLGTRLIPKRARLLLTLAITAIVAEHLPAPPTVAFWSAQTVMLIASEILIGVVFGFFIQIFFQVFQVAGQFIAMQNGLGFATLVDPVNGINVASVGQFFLLMTNLLFLSLGGHLIVLEVLISSFHVIEISDSSKNLGMIEQLLAFVTWMFRSAVLIALPSVTALLITNISFGLMARVAPQLNIFSVGFPFNMVFGLVVLWLVFIGFLPIYERIAEQALVLAQALLLS